MKFQVWVPQPNAMLSSSTLLPSSASSSAASLPSASDGSGDSDVDHDAMLREAAKASADGFSSLLQTAFGHDLQLYVLI